MSFQRQFRPNRYLLPAAQFRAGFTLIEIVIALAVLGTMAAGVYLGFNAVNTYAVSSRLYSEAQTAAQNQIDLILSREPFDVKTAYITGSFDATANKVPIELITTAEIDALAASGVTFPTAAPTATPALTSSYYRYYPYYRSGLLLLGGWTAPARALVLDWDSVTRGPGSLSNSYDVTGDALNDIKVTLIAQKQ